MSEHYNKDFKRDYLEYSQAITDRDYDVRPILRAEAYSSGGSGSTSDSTVNGSYIKSEYGWGDYSYFRPLEADPVSIEEEIASCLCAYRCYPFVSNIIDLMADFGSQGVRIICADKRQEKFIQEWSKFVELQEFSARFLSTLYRAGTVIVKRTDGKVPIKIQKEWKSTAAAVFPYSFNNPSNKRQPSNKDPIGSDIQIEEVEVKKSNMPLKWTIYNPLQVKLVGGLLGQFVGKPIFGLRINSQLRQELSQLPTLAYTSEDYQNFMKMIPSFVIDAINNSSDYFPLDQEKIYAYYYKKDDWDLWGKPIIGPILKDLRHYNKIRLAESSALDGAISSIRLWTVGDIEHGVIPQKGTLERLRQILRSGVGGGTMDIVWGPDLKFQESNSNLYEFLKPEKYKQTLDNIHAGLGIPAGLTSGSGSGSSDTRAFTGLKTLVERLKYGRNILVKFLETQLKLVQQSMGFDKPFRVVFDQLMLSDEAAEKAVLLQMWDRDIISTETIRYAIDIDNSDIEDLKIAREGRKRGRSLPAKASPFHNPEKEHDMKKIFAQRGGHTPSELGLDLLPKKDGEESPNEQMFKLKGKEAQYKPTGSPMSGRPVNSKDSVKRKKRRVMPKGVSAEYKDLFLYAEEAKAKLEEYLTPSFISDNKKKDIRLLSVDETDLLNNLKFAALSSLQPFQEVGELFNSNNISLDEDIYYEALRLENNHIEKYGRKPSIHERRKIDCEAYANIYSEVINECEEVE